MIVRQSTLPWIPGQRSGPAVLNSRRRSAPRRRGLGDDTTLSFPQFDPTTSAASPTLSFPWLVPADGSTGAALPCIPVGAMGPPALGQSYCGSPAMTTADNWDSKTSPSVAGVCFQMLFPFVGQKSADGSCVPVVNLPSPWPVIITAGLGAFLGFKLLGGRR